MLNQVLFSHFKLSVFTPFQVIIFNGYLFVTLVAIHHYSRAYDIFTVFMLKPTAVNITFVMVHILFRRMKSLFSRCLVLHYLCVLFSLSTTRTSATWLHPHATWNFLIKCRIFVCRRFFAISIALSVIVYCWCWRCLVKLLRHTHMLKIWPTMHYPVESEAKICLDIFIIYDILPC